MYQEKNVKIPEKIAGLMLSAILSDTLMFHSPTCTLRDQAAARALSVIAGENIEEYAKSMFEAGEDLSGRDADDILHTDYKEFSIGDYNISVGQGFFMSEKAYGIAEKMVADYLPKEQKRSGMNMIFYMLTSIPQQGTLLLYACQQKETADSADPRAASRLTPFILTFSAACRQPVRYLCRTGCNTGTS